MFDYLRKLRDTKKFYPGRILDIGAYNGVWTREVKGIWPIARYTCIEAGPKHRRTLKFLTKDFHIAVLGDKNRNVKMHLRKIQNKFQEKIAYTKGSTLFSVFPDFEERQMQTLASVSTPTEIITDSGRSGSFANQASIPPVSTVCFVVRLKFSAESSPLPIVMNSRFRESKTLAYSIAMLPDPINHIILFPYSGYGEFHLIGASY